MKIKNTIMTFVVLGCVCLFAFLFYQWANMSSVASAHYAYIRQTNNISSYRGSELFYLRSSKDQGFSVNVSNAPEVIKRQGEVYVLFFAARANVSLSFVPSSYKYKFYNFDQPRLDRLFPGKKNSCSEFRMNSFEYNYAKDQLLLMLNSEFFKEDRFKQKNLSDTPVRVCGLKKV